MLRAGAAAAEEAGRAGRAAEAAHGYRELLARAASALGAADPETLRLRHQLAHWTGESGNAEAAVVAFAQLFADQERYQGAQHPHTQLARHQLAHWHGRAGRPDEAVRRYEAMQRTAAQEGRTEAALDLLCNVGHWQAEAGDTAAALRTFTQMLRTAERELGSEHRITGIARDRYARLAGGLPFGQERGHDGLHSLRAAARAVEAAGEPRRAVPMYRQVADRSEQLYGAGADQTLDARVEQAQAAVRARDHAAASASFDQVLACLRARGEGPGSPEYDALCAQRDVLAERAGSGAVRLTPAAAREMARDVMAAPRSAFGMLVGGPGGAHATEALALAARADGYGVDEVPAELWARFAREVTGAGRSVVALYSAGPGLGLRPGVGRACGQLGVPAVSVAREDDLRMLTRAYALRDDGPVIVPLEQVTEDLARDVPPAAPQPSQEQRTVFDAQARALDGWSGALRVRPAREPDDPVAFGPYEVLQGIGRGGFGRVYLCRDAEGLLVAVKTLHAEYAADDGIRQGFAHEVRAALRVRDEYTVPVIAADTDAPTPWMAVPYVSAPSLQEVAQLCGPLDETTVRRVGAGIATALTAIHRAGIVHLDLKPANVLMTEDGPRVIDFGIAQIERLTEPREGFAGTYAYASPEQLHEAARFTPASDVFSLGTLLARLALGRLPWGAEAPEVIYRICSGTPDLTGLPEGLAEVVRRCLSTEPAERPAPAEVAAALVPGADDGRIDPPRLSDAARELIRDHSTLPVTRRYETLAYTKAETAEDTTVAAAQGRTTDDGGAPAPAARGDGSAEGASASTRTGDGTEHDAARDLEARVLAWERGTAARPTQHVLRECSAFLDEARERLGGRHPLTLRLTVSCTLLACEGPEGVARVERAVAEAAVHLGEGHPTVREARALLSLLDPGQ
ncbi:protein kinase domain-containing protein [Streptomyces poonensis]|uniref:Protein kinase domain-containing protein n=1 Tax=Streptomyces poonensis TaxID=68255 RepID=A0A918PZZ7_9ACTN|nr:protein kinase [Streptomyces poonensis]GGZ28969.1 hypothetical protein GCM10010365_56480 [Streptomyces poonensis]